jgi:rhamnulokinase
MSSFAAIDLGATSGRVAVGTVVNGAISYEIIHRFPNGARESDSGSFVWDWDELITQIKNGLVKAAAKYSLTSIGVDTWAVDYVLVDSQNYITSPAYSYRDLRTDGVMELVISDFGKEAFYQRTGIQFLPFNTIYQLIAARDAGELAGDRTFVMLPDAINMALTGSRSVEITNASTTQLLNARTRSWDTELIDLLHLPRGVFPLLHEAKTTLGTVKEIPELAGVRVVAVGSHDTASAVAAAPIGSDSIYISSGTWSLIGCESTEPNTSAAAMAVNLTNELGVEGTVRLLKNVAGMWIISECLREWNESGDPISIEELVEEARRSDSLSRINPNDEIFLHPGKMVERIQYQVMISGGKELRSKGEIAYVIYASLAESYAKTISEIETVTGRQFTNIHVVGGGSSNEFLNQLTADATGLEVNAGPVEATLLGNIGVQAIAADEITNLEVLREIISHSFEHKIFQPSINSTARG